MGYKEDFDQQDELESQFPCYESIKTEALNEDIAFLSEDATDETASASDIVEPKEEKKNGMKGFLFDLIFYGILIFACIYIIPNYVMQRTIVDGSSMEETLSNGDHLYVEKISYRFDMLKRFDIIVFYPYGRDNKEYYVKRIIGMPGETVQINDGVIYINNEPLDEHYGAEPIEDPGRAADPVTLGEDEYFVMGDNRNISKDSRYAIVGNVSKKNIGGKAFFRVSPLSKFGTLD